MWTAAARAAAAAARGKGTGLVQQAKSKAVDRMTNNPLNGNPRVVDRKKFAQKLKTAYRQQKVFHKQSGLDKVLPKGSTVGAAYVAATYSRGRTQLPAPKKGK